MSNKWSPINSHFSSIILIFYQYSCSIQDTVLSYHTSGLHSQTPRPGAVERLITAQESRLELYLGCPDTIYWWALYFFPFDSFLINFFLCQIVLFESCCSHEHHFVWRTFVYVWVSPVPPINYNTIVMHKLTAI